MPIKQLIRTITSSDDYPGGISTLPTKQEIVDKVNEVIELLNTLEEKLEYLNNTNKK